MTCPVCGGKTKVVDVVTIVDCNYRRRKCICCNYVCKTIEVECNDDEYVSRQTKSYKRRNNLEV